MSKLDNYKAQMRQRKAAKLGMTLEQFDRHVAEEQARIDALHRIMNSRQVQLDIIAAHARRHDRNFTILDPTPLP